MLWKLLAADIERIEGIGAIGAVFEKVFFGLRLLLHGLVFAEAVASSLHSCGLDGEDKVIVVLAVEVRNEALLASKDEYLSFWWRNKSRFVHRHCMGRWNKLPR